jgi:hypothetical protein
MRSKRLEKEYGKNDERYLHRSPSVALDNPNWFNVAATERLSVFLGTIPQQSQIAHKVWKVCGRENRDDRTACLLAASPVCTGLYQHARFFGLPRLPSCVLHSPLQVLRVPCPGLGVRHLFTLSGIRCNARQVAYQLCHVSKPGQLTSRQVRVEVSPLRVAHKQS